MLFLLALTFYHSPAQLTLRPSNRGSRKYQVPDPNLVNNCPRIPHSQSRTRSGNPAYFLLSAILTSSIAGEGRCQREVDARR